MKCDADIASHPSNIVSLFSTTLVLSITIHSLSLSHRCRHRHTHHHHPQLQHEFNKSKLLVCTQIETEREREKESESLYHAQTVCNSLFNGLNVFLKALTTLSGQQNHRCFMCYRIILLRSLPSVMDICLSVSISLQCMFSNIFQIMSYHLLMLLDDDLCIPLSSWMTLYQNVHRIILLNIREYSNVFW